MKKAICQIPREGIMNDTVQGLTQATANGEHRVSKPGLRITNHL